MVQPGHAEIVGAGFGGLVAAICLAQRGWRVRVHERRATVRGEGYGIAIHRNMAHIFETFGLLDGVLAGGMRIDRRDSMDRRGDVVMSAKTLRSSYRIDRQHIIALLAQRAVDVGVEIRFESEVIGATSEGVLRFHNGTAISADLVVQASVSLGGPVVDQGWVWWSEARAEERGRAPPVARFPSITMLRAKGL